MYPTRAIMVIWSYSVITLQGINAGRPAKSENEIPWLFQVFQTIFSQIPDHLQVIELPFEWSHIDTKYRTKIIVAI